MRVRGRDMKMKKILYITTAIFLLLGAAISTAEEKDPQIVFKWAFLLTKEGQKEQVIDAKATTSVTAKDMLQIYFERENEVYIYIFLLGTNNSLDMLYPVHPADFSGNASVKGKIYLPGKDRYFQFDDNPGDEKFFFLASATRLEELESLTTDYIQEQVNKDEKKAKVLDSIKQIRRKYSQLTSLVEKGVPIAGTIKYRTIRPPDPVSANLVEAEQFYSETIRLKHE